MPVYNKGMKKKVISVSRHVMGGTPVFAGTRVPVQTLLDYLEAGDSIDEFLDGFPTVKRKQVIAFLEETKARVIAYASNAVVRVARATQGVGVLEHPLDAQARTERSDEVSLRITRVRGRTVRRA